MVGMASCDIHGVVNSSVLGKIESFLNDPSYKEAIENSASYNTRLCFERRLRMPFLDSQTGVAQNHSNLFMSPRQRIPGLLEGQIYTYPAKRWRKKRRQYLMHYMQQPKRKEADPEADVHTITTVENPAATNEDSKDSAGLKDESAKDAWYYDEIDMQEIEGFEEPDPESDLDYEEPYSKRRSKKRSSKVVKTADTPSSKKPKGPGRGRKKINYDASVDAEKPFSCELCGVRYKTRPGLTYHYTHSHKDVDDDDCSSSGAGGPEGGSGSTSIAERNTSQQQQQQQPVTQQQAPPPPAPPQQTQTSTEAASAAGWSKFQDSYLTFLKTPGSSTRRTKASGSQNTSSSVPSVPTSTAMEAQDENVASNANSSGMDKLASEIPQTMPGEDKDRAVPSPYCDFCLGDANQNKKTGESEELVSCSDCGRSGHPTCLQFTPNMIVSVRKYRWQCIECKCCSICGNSDNDDQLLFCDDCDRGYHMYCLAPPLLTPPEGSWSCSLCLIEFHKK